MAYKYDPIKRHGVIKVIKEYRQQCKRCKKMCRPDFDEMACDFAAKKIVSRIKKVFYCEAVEGGSDRHPKALPRKKPHESRLCEACQLGVCPEGRLSDEFGFLGLHPRRPPIREYYGTRENISWHILIANMA